MGPTSCEGRDGLKGRECSTIGEESIGDSRGSAESAPEAARLLVVDDPGEESFLLPLGFESRGRVDEPSLVDVEDSFK